MEEYSEVAREFCFFCERLRNKIIIVGGREVSKAEAFAGGLSSTDILTHRYVNVCALEKIW